MNLDTSLLLYLESGTMIRSGTSLLLGIDYTIVVILLFIFLLQIQAPCFVDYGSLFYLGFFEPYFDLPCFRSSTPKVSSVPLTIWYLTPGKSLTRPPRTRTTECSWRLWPIPGIYAVTSTPVVNRTLATFRKAELGFLGVEVYTRVQTPLFWGAPLSAGVLVFFFIRFLPFLTS
jgi:hypothetical protein